MRRDARARMASSTDVAGRPALSRTAFAPPPSHWALEPFKDIFAGTVGGVLSKAIEYPFDTLKVRLQAGQAGQARCYAGPLDCARQTIAESGVRGLYRGMSLPLAGTVLETAVLFTSNGALKRELVSTGNVSVDDELPMRYVLACGAGTGLIVSWVLTPIELVKCRLQVVNTAGGAAAYRGPLDVLRQSIMNEGLRVLYKGHTATMLRETPGTAAWFGAYELFIRAMTPVGVKRKDLPPTTVVCAGALGGISYWSVMYPCDTIKSAMQIDQSPRAGAGAGVTGGGAALALVPGHAAVHFCAGRGARAVRGHRAYACARGALQRGAIFRVRVVAGAH